MNRAGARAEELCAELLRKAGLRVLARNWRCRHGEIDLVAEEGATLPPSRRVRSSFSVASRSLCACSATVRASMP